MASTRFQDRFGRRWYHNPGPRVDRMLQIPLSIMRAMCSLHSAVHTNGQRICSALHPKEGEDCYILFTPDGQRHAGIRYGSMDHEYLAPGINRGVVDFVVTNHVLHASLVEFEIFNHINNLLKEQK